MQEYFRHINKQRGLIDECGSEEGTEGPLLHGHFYKGAGYVIELFIAEVIDTFLDPVEGFMPLSQPVIPCLIIGEEVVGFLIQN